MKTYAIEFTSTNRRYYVVEANTEKSAKNLALDELRLDADSKYFHNAEFMVTNIGELKLCKP